MSMRDKIFAVLPPDIGSMARWRCISANIIEILPDYDAQQARIDELIEAGQDYINTLRARIDELEGARILNRNAITRKQTRIDKLEAIALAGQALAELMKSWNVEPKSVIDAALKAYAEALKGTDT